MEVSDDWVGSATWRATSRRSPRRSPRSTSPVTGTIPETLERALRAQRPEPGRTRDRRPTTGSPATGWCTASGCATARPSGTATAGSAPRRAAAALGEPERRRARIHGDMDTRQHQRRSATPASTLAHRRGGRPARSSSPTSSTRSRRPTSTARCSGHSPPTRSATPTPASCTRSSTTGRRPYVQYIVVGADGKVRREVDDRDGRAADDARLAVTESYAVFFDLPVHVQHRRAPAGSASRTVGRRPRGARRRAAPRGQQRRRALVRHRPLLRVPPDERLRRRTTAWSLDVVRHPKMFAPTSQRARRGRAHARSVDDRPVGGKVVEERLDDRGQEFPRLDERLVGKPYRFGYTVATLRRPARRRAT